MPDPVPLVSLQALATELARDASALLLDGLTRARSSVTTKSTSTDMVTEMDRAAEALIAAGIRAARPDDGIVGEEGTADAGTSGVRWIIDPIDGTTNYLYGLHGFGVSIAAEIDGEPAVGVVVDPVRGDLYSATKGGGAALNGSRIRVSALSDLSTALVGTGFSYDRDRRRRQAAVLVQVLPQVRDIRRFGAASLDLCLVASGRFDAYYEKGLNRWDYAAGALIAAEAGARLGDLDGGPPSSGFMLASAVGLFEPLRDLLAAAGARDA
ncbi:MAG TPA: inositol monophosphatase family protein [Acidimicrobiales bacterium]|nr:inositol monophosphatase family protein [Acidimicrobiales bacterium]